jgi:hypothetical protein
MHPITELEADHISVELEALVAALHAHYDVTQAQLPSDEGAYGTGRLERLLSREERAVERFGSHAVRISELNDVDNSTALSSALVPMLHLESRRFKTLSERPEGAAILDLPADEIEVIDFIFDYDKPVVIVVHAEEKGAVGLPA